MFLNKRVSVAVVAAVLVLATVTGLAAAAAGGKTESSYQTVAGGYSQSEIRSGRHAQYQPEAETVQSVYTVEGYTLRMESDVLQVWVQEDTSRIRIVDKRSGYVWGLCEDEKPNGLNKSWFARASALCAMDYYDESGSDKSASTESKGAKLKFRWGKESFICEVDMTEQGIRFAVEVSLTGESLHLAVVEGSVVEYGECMLKSLYFMPFLGSTLSDTVNGYFFVPDGCGALLRFQKPSDYNSALVGRIYGADPGIDSLTTAANLLASRGNDYLVEENVMTLPVFGIVHGEGQNGVFAIVDGGIEQAYITASVAGVITDYNWLTARFDYRTSYMKPVNKAGSGVYTAQEKANDILPSVEYVFLTGEDADYSSMAVYYRDRLKAAESLPSTEAEEEIPLWLSVLGAEIKEGVLYDTTTVLTTIEDGQTITTQLQDAGISNLKTCYVGWEKGGLNGSRYGETRLENRLGSRGALDAWRESIIAGGGSFSLYRNLGQANEDQISLRSQAALNISSAYIHYSVDNDTLMYPDSYVVKAALAAETLEKTRNKWQAYPLTLDNIGINPYSDYTRNANVSRLDTMHMMSDTLTDPKAAGTAVFQPSPYQWMYVSDYLEMPMTSSQFTFETDTVPFLQIVLKGSMNYYSPYMNLGFYSDNAVLKMVEFGAYPSFIVAQAESHELEDTPLETMFSVCFADWSNRITDIYGYVSGALNAVEGQKIAEHKMVASGVARVRYDGGVTIYVNYNNTVVSIDGVTVPAMGYLVEGGKV